MHHDSGDAARSTVNVVTAPISVCDPLPRGRGISAASRFPSVSAIHTGLRSATSRRRLPNRGSTTIATTYSVVSLIHTSQSATRSPSLRGDADVIVEKFWREVEAVRPGQRTELRIDGELAEQLEIAERLEHLSP